MENLSANEKNIPPKKEVRLFGRNISDIVCFRNSFICGICTGVAGGLIAFMFTSKARVSSHIAFTSLWIGVFLYWIPCRYKYESSMLMGHQWKKAQELSRKKIIEEEEASNNVSSTESSEENK